MNQILSHKEKAQRVATQMGDALSTLVPQPQIDYAYETTVQGNAKAHETVKLNQQTIKAFVAALENDIKDSDYRDKLRDSEYKKVQDNPAYNKHGGNVIVSDKNNPTLDESNALLLTHSANIDKYSFAAEIKFHAEYAESMLESIKNSAIKSDMGVGESKDYGRFVPFYSLGEERYKEEKGDLYLDQEKHH